MATLGSEILDAQIAYRRPVTSRVMRAIRNNIAGTAAKYAIYSPKSLNATTSSTTFQTLFSFKLFIPGCVVGSSGTKMTITDLSLQNVSSVVPRLCTYKVAIGANESDPKAVPGSSVIATSFSVTWTATSDQSTTVDVMAKVSTSANSAHVTFLPAGGLGDHTYIQLEPV